jgi:hypothetical protein
MAKQDYEFTLILSGVRELTRAVLDALYEAGCDDALIGIRDGVAFADFCREASSFRQAVLTAIHDIETAGIGAKVEHIEPDELVTMSEIARRLHLSREGVRKWVAGLRGPGNFPPPVGSLTRRSPLWRWTDVIQWHRKDLAKEPGNGKGIEGAVSRAGKKAAEEPQKEKSPSSRRSQGRQAGFHDTDMNALMNLGSDIAAVNAALDLRRRVSLEEAIQLLQTIAVDKKRVESKRAADLGDLK